MGLRMKFTVAIFATLLFSRVAVASWNGPSEVLSGTWGENPGQFAIQYDDTSDTFPTTMDISPSGRIAITEDQTLERVQIFNSSGQLINIINTFAFTIAFDSNDNLYVSGGGLRKYDSSGKEVWSKTGTSYDALYALSSGDIIGYDKDNKNYTFFSSTGQVSKTSTTKPLELGVVKSVHENADGSGTTVIQYPDVTYSIQSPKLLEYFTRDVKGGFYGVIKTGPAGKQYYRTYKFSRCGKIITSVDSLPDNIEVTNEIGRPTPEVDVIEEYGQPVIAPNGDVYTWKRTSDNYSILKWTWQDNPNVPSGPDAPTNLAVAASINGLYLTWVASPQDPGCVTGYEIDQATTSGGPYTVLTTVNAGTLKYNDASAAAGTTYYYKIRAVSGTDYSSYTGAVSGKR